MYLFPSQISQVIHTSGRKFISNFIEPAPLHASQRPPLTLKLKWPGVYPLSLDSVVCENNLRISSKTLVYVAGFERGVLPIGDWSIIIDLSMSSRPVIEVCLPGFVSALCRVLCKTGAKIPEPREDFPEP